jgi:serine/threonine protein kinase
MRHESMPVDHLGLPEDHRALIREACDESEHIFIAPMDKGLSGSTVWQARWRVRGTSQLSALHVLKIGTRSKLESEERNIQNYVSVIDSVPNVVLYPRNANTERPREEVALLRQRFAGDATGRTVSLRQFIKTESRCPNVESAVKVLERLYSERISRWHGQQSISDAADTESALSWKSLGAELASWFGKIDLQAAADQIGASALDASLQRMSGRSLDNVIRAVHQVSQRRFQKPIGIVHGDLHAQNVNVDSSGRLHLIDFGSTGIGWRAADFLMMECSLRFTSSPPQRIARTPTRDG